MNSELAIFLYKKLNQAEELSQPTNYQNLETEKCKCHENAKRWVEKHPTDKVVSGWLIWNREGFSIQFIAHSVVDCGQDRLLDITPEIPSNYKFIRHQEEWGEFDVLNAGRSWAEYFFIEPTIPPGSDKDSQSEWW